MLAKTKFNNTNRHSHKGLKQPSVESIPKLCKIIFTIDDNDFQIEIFASSNIKQLAKQLADFLKLQCDQFFEEQIYNKMKQLYDTTDEDDEWRSDMQGVMQTAISQRKHNRTNIKLFDQNSTRQLQIDANNWEEAIKSVNDKFRSKRYYFQTNRMLQNCGGLDDSQDCLFKSEQDQRMPHDLNLYDKALYSRKTKQTQANKLKIQRQRESMKECTFKPKINTRVKSKTPQAKQNVFAKLYQNAIDLKRKRQERFNTLQSEKQQEISHLPFAPLLNQCSRQIIRKKNQSVESVRSFNRHCESHQILTKKDLNGSGYFDSVQNKKHDQAFTFHPQISKNTKELTKDLPSIEQRLRRYQQNDTKKRLSPNTVLLRTKNTNTNPSFQRMNIKKPNKPFFSSNQQNKIIKNDSNNNSTAKKTFQKKNAQQDKKKLFKSTSKKNLNTMSQIIKPKKQLYHIQDAPIFTNQSHYEQLLQDKPVQVFQDITNTVKQNIYKQKTIPKQTRSQQLYNNRKNAIFQRIFAYLSQEKNISTPQFSKSQNKQTKNETAQVTCQKILSHPHLPSVVKNMFAPVTSQMSQLNISLNHQQFVWALQKIYESLTIGDKGVLLGWGVKLLPQNSSFS